MIKIGLIGCGGRLRDVTKWLIKATDQVEIIGLYDPHEASIDNAKKQFNPDATVYNSYEELVANPEIDWVMIGSWNCFHAKQVLAAFKAGKHVFCEKPLALSVEDCITLKKAQEETGLKLVIGFTLRYSAHYRKIKDILSSGQIGDIISLEFNENLSFDHGGYIHGDWRRKREYAGTHLLEKCCHDIDIVNWIVESRADKVASFGGCNFFTSENIHHQERIGKGPGGKNAFEAWGGPNDGISQQNPFNDDKDIVDNQVAIIEFENHVRATFHTNCCTGIPERRLLICGTEGTLRSELIDGSIDVCRYGYDAKVVDESIGSTDGHGGGDKILGEELADNMLKGAPVSTTLMNGLVSAFTAFGIDQALDEGRVVDMKSYWDQL
ncbi:MAG: Gfo/Idh/MocA family oxidoreductase [Lentisphaeria bacterium]|nr:Gfo/Idh/MocA family oxidoreductase [Lentisphaeria bacterium]